MLISFFNFSPWQHWTFFIFITSQWKMTGRILRKEQRWPAAEVKLNSQPTKKKAEVVYTPKFREPSSDFVLNRWLFYLYLHRESSHKLFCHSGNYIWHTHSVPLPEQCVCISELPWFTSEWCSSTALMLQCCYCCSFYIEFEYSHHNKISL